MKRFWEKAETVSGDSGHGVALDGKPVNTPGREPLVVPSLELAAAIADEWAECGEEIDPGAMPMTGLANAAIDRIAPAKDDFAAGLARYGENDLTCYRADNPRELVERQSKAWDPLLDWARRRYDVDFACQSGVMHVPQPEETVRKLGHAVAILDPFRLAGLSHLVTSSGSLITGLAVLEGAVGPDEAWHAACVDETWQSDQWGKDQEAQSVLAARRADFMNGARFLELLGG